MHDGRCLIHHMEIIVDVNHVVIVMPATLSPCAMLMPYDCLLLQRDVPVPQNLNQMVDRFPCASGTRDLLVTVLLPVACFSHLPSNVHSCLRALTCSYQVNLNTSAWHMRRTACDTASSLRVARTAEWARQ